MLSNSIVVHNLISFNNFRIVSPATFLNKLDVVLTLSDECQQHLHSRLKYVLVNNWNYTEYIPVVLHYLIDNYL